MISVVVISKDEPVLHETLGGVCEQARELGEDWEVLVVDASEGRLERIRQRHPGVRWIDFTRPRGVTISIPHQRNVDVREARGDIIVFTDAGCVPFPGWLERLVEPLLHGGEQVTAGISSAPEGQEGLYDTRIHAAAQSEYLSECPTLNMAFRREAFDAVDGFDESFEYGSDIDFSWRLVEAGRRIRSVPTAVVRHDWGGQRRQLKRAYLYGRARARLYRKHRTRLLRSWRRDPMIIVYPSFLLGLPLTRRFPLYPALLAIPAWRNREEGPLRVIADHLTFGVGALSTLVKP
jgi:glycosyltransferase involved in cell wall biosynthesis